MARLLPNPCLNEPQILVATVMAPHLNLLIMTKPTFFDHKCTLAIFFVTHCQYYVMLPLGLTNIYFTK